MASRPPVRDDVEQPIVKHERTLARSWLQRALTPLHRRAAAECHVDQLGVARPDLRGHRARRRLRAAASRAARAHRTVIGRSGRCSNPEWGCGPKRLDAVRLVLARRNDYRLGLINGLRGRILATDADRGQLTVGFPTGPVIVPSGYLAGGGLDHGYALTVHAAQGLTTDTVFLLADDSLYQEAGYVAMSRARTHTQLHLADTTDQADPAREDSHLPPAPRDPLDILTTTLGRSRAQQLAHNTLDR